MLTLIQTHTQTHTHTQTNTHRLRHTHAQADRHHLNSSGAKCQMSSGPLGPFFFFIKFKFRLKLNVIKAAEIRLIG